MRKWLSSICYNRYEAESFFSAALTISGLLCWFVGLGKRHLATPGFFWNSFLELNSIWRPWMTNIIKWLLVVFKFKLDLKKFKILKEYCKKNFEKSENNFHNFYCRFHSLLLKGIFKKIYPSLSSPLIHLVLFIYPNCLNYHLDIFNPLILRFIYRWLLN